MVATEDGNICVADGPGNPSGLYDISLPPKREGWETYAMGDCGYVSFPKESQPDIKWKHIDGPMLSCRDGTIHWLTYWERFCFFVGLINIEQLDAKYGHYTKCKRIH